MELLGNWATVAVVAAVLTLSSGCTEGGADDNSGNGPETARPDAAELAERLGCDRIGPAGHAGWDEQRPVRCYTDEGWAAIIHAPLAQHRRAAALNLLQDRYGDGRGLVPCPDGSEFNDVSVLYGEMWIAVVTSDAGADRVRDRLGGTILSGNGTGPPVSYLSLPCTSREETPAPKRR